MKQTPRRGGASPIEYGLIAALISVAAITAMNGLGAQLNNTAAEIIAETRLPAEPGDYWIWPDRADAEQWQREHPEIRLCLTAVPDGIATERC